MKQYPYPKKPRLLSDDLSSQDAEWHDSLKPSFSNNGIFTYAVPGSAPHPSGELVPAIQGFVGERFDVRFSKFVPAPDVKSETLSTQKHNTKIDTSGAFPSARPPDDDLTFTELLEHVHRDSSSVAHEESIWTICGVLFDPLDIVTADSFVNNVPNDRGDEFIDRIRLDTMVGLWRDMMWPYAQDGLKRARTPEEKALYHLTQNDIGDACHALLEAMDFKLAALVAQLPGSQRSREMMKTQISAWKDRNDWSEFSEPVRALYSILAGELCIVQGKPDTSENRVAQFNIAERFELSWQQSFALRLFYGGHDSIEAVVRDYMLDIKAKKETKKPLTRWPNGKETNDILFEILSLVAEPRPKATFDPLTISGSAMNSRLTWQLASLLNRKNICTTPTEQLDRLAYNYAMELENARDIVTSAWVLLHIRDESARQNAVRGVLIRNGGLISAWGNGDNAIFEELTQDLKIPATLVWMASALYAKAGLHNPALETEWLLKANDIEAAHEILYTTLGPQAVIEQDYEVLSHALKLFPRRLPDGWQRGGQVYLDFVRLVQARTRQRLSPDDEAAMKRLRRGLAEMEEDVSRQSQVERVAVFEMGKVLEEVSRDHHGGEKDRKMGGGEDAAGSSVGMDMLRRYQQAMDVGV
jgi:nuclear pore complex protein Nup98-Nup96